jgi:hypothetical protein
MKRLAIGILVLGLFLNGNTHSFAQTQEQLIAGAKKEGKLVVYASATAPAPDVLCGIQQKISLHQN